MPLLSFKFLELQDLPLTGAYFLFAANLIIYKKRFISLANEKKLLILYLVGDFFKKANKICKKIFFLLAEKNRLSNVVSR
jgi:hypothetical protein